MSYFTRYVDKCSRLHSFPVTRFCQYRRKKKFSLSLKPKFFFVQTNVCFTVGFLYLRARWTHRQFPYMHTSMPPSRRDSTKNENVYIPFHTKPTQQISFRWFLYALLRQFSPIGKKHSLKGYLGLVKLTSSRNSDIWGRLRPILTVSSPQPFFRIRRLRDPPPQKKNQKASNSRKYH